ncbi:UNVERIFIED_CONTAM: transcriptional regulator [Mumia flava]|uniref:LysR family transcriptional regulator n=1 Tax=Mumia flava TaxID=1348852 RepID=UPI00057443E5|nr:LysR family transcriptional regulator [Mumia flava]
MDDGQSDASGLDRLASVDLNLLVPLLALLEERSVTRAAARVGLSQPAMSHALGRMRRLLGDELLVRHGAGMTLTPRAAELVVPLRQALEHAGRVVRFPGFDPATDRRTITVASTTSTAFVLGSALARLVAQGAPQATLRLRTFAVPAESDFTSGGVDAVLLSEGVPAPYPRERLYDDRWVVVAAPDAAPVDATALDLLRDLPHVVFEEGLRSSAPYVALDDHRIPYRVGQLVPDNMLIPALVAPVGGVAVHRASVIGAMSEMFPLRVAEFPYPLPGLGIDLVWNPRLADASFIDWLGAVLVEAARLSVPAAP